MVPVRGAPCVLLDVLRIGLTSGGHSMGKLVFGPSYPVKFHLSRVEESLVGLGVTETKNSDSLLPAPSPTALPRAE